MKTQIFKDFSEFYGREDKTLNGVSQEFADANPGYEQDNETNKGCWNCSYCSDCSRCSGCSGCSGCSDLEFEKNQQDKKAVNAMLNIPKIENIHSAVLAAVDQPEALDMSTWHTCGTTHCRAGWVVTLAGAPGKALEKQTSTEFAAMMIYKASSDIRVSPTRFYEDSATALADIKRCAEEETAKAVF